VNRWQEFGKPDKTPDGSFLGSNITGAGATCTGGRDHDVQILGVYPGYLRVGSLVILWGTVVSRMQQND